MGLDHWLVAKNTIERHDWRKFNALHKWFCDNVNGGEEINCEEKHVSKEKLKSLLELLEKSLNDKENASKYLPTRTGFFFGSTEYDEWYWKDVEKTINVIKKFLCFNDDVEIFYNAWW
jgi:hypothetical protein